jgi:hypothetical protein
MHYGGAMQEKVWFDLDSLLCIEPIVAGNVGPVFYRKVSIFMFVSSRACIELAASLSVSAFLGFEPNQCFESLLLSDNMHRCSTMY